MQGVWRTPKKPNVKKIKKKEGKKLTKSRKLTKITMPFTWVKSDEFLRGGKCDNLWQKKIKCARYGKQTCFFILA